MPMTSDKRFDAIAAKCRRHMDGHVVENADLRLYSRWRVGGTARIVAEPASAGGLRELLATLAKVDCPKVVVGDGSNILFDDAGFEGVVIRIGRSLGALKIEGQNVSVEAGLWVPRFARAVGSAGLTGLEHVIGIPGTLGGLIVMNGGSQRKGVGDHLVHVECADWNGIRHSFTRAECRFGYRHSILQERRLMVLSASFAFERGEVGAIRRAMIDIMASRRRKFPKNYPNCGSVFLSDPAMYDMVGPPGRAIEAAQLKGVRKGDAQISPLHTNFIVNLGNASSADILWLIHLARTKVFEQTGFRMDCEVRHIAPDGRVRMAHETADETL